MPVYEITFGDVVIILRGNYHDWKVTVISLGELYDLDKTKTFRKMEKIKSVECILWMVSWIMGTWVKGSYFENKKEFTVEVYDGYELYVLMKAISTQLEIKY